jgi:beta-mannosidase
MDMSPTRHFMRRLMRRGCCCGKTSRLQWLYHRDILAKAQTQVRQMVELLNNHPSIILWCMHNESFYMADTSDERLWSKLRTYLSVFIWNWNRNVLDASLQQIVATVDPSRPTVRSSGEYAVPLIHAGTDAHFYYGWYKIYGELASWQKIIDLFPQNSRFVTEFGAQSFPNYASAIKFMAADINAIDWATLQRKHSFQPDMLGHWLDWRAAPDLQTLIDMTQEYQIAIHRHYIDRLRMRKYQPTGGFCRLCSTTPIRLFRGRLSIIGGCPNARMRRCNWRSAHSIFLCVAKNDHAPRRYHRHPDIGGQ